MIRQLTQPAERMLKHFESLRLESYLDLERGIWTIGWGHTGPHVKAGMRVTETQAEILFIDDRDPACAFVQRMVTSATDNQFGALVSLCFNIGDTAFRTSSVLREHNLGHFVIAADWFAAWNKAHVDGQLKVVRGLTRRREVERTFYLS